MSICYPRIFFSYFATLEFINWPICYFLSISVRLTVKGDCSVKLRIAISLPLILLFLSIPDNHPKSSAFSSIGEGAIRRNSMDSDAVTPPPHLRRLFSIMRSLGRRVATAELGGRNLTRRLGQLTKPSCIESDFWASQRGKKASPLRSEKKNLCLVASLTENVTEIDKGVANWPICES